MIYYENSVIKDFQHLCDLRNKIQKLAYVYKVELVIWIETIELCPHLFLIQNNYTLNQIFLETTSAALMIGYAVGGAVTNG